MKLFTSTGKRRLLHETSGPTELAVGAVADGEFLKRSGRIIVGGAAGGGGPPEAHHATHEPSGTDPMAVDAAAGTGSLRTIGSSALTACAGNDGRLSDARTPAAHHATHEPAGSDPIAVDAAATTGSLRTIGTGALQGCAGNDSRLSNARTPTAHTTTHQHGGSDEVATATPAPHAIPKASPTGTLDAWVSLGPEIQVGTSVNNTLRWNGSGWAESSLLTNDDDSVTAYKLIVSAGCTINSMATLNAGRSIHYIQIAADYQVLLTDEYVGCADAAGHYTVTLPALADTQTGMCLEIADEGAINGSYTVTVTAHGDLIDGVAADIELDTPHQAVSFRSAYYNGDRSWKIV